MFTKSVFVIFILIAHCSVTRASDFFHGDHFNNYQKDHNWQEFSADVKAHTEAEQNEGFAYIVTGSLALIGGAAGYFSNQDPFAKAAFSVTESLGIAGIGYGVYQYQIGSSEREFENIISSSSSLTPKQRDEILARYLVEKKNKRENSRNILRLTYGTIALANLVNATQEKDPVVRTGLYFLSGFNALGLLSLTF